MSGSFGCAPLVSRRRWALLGSWPLVALLAAGSVGAQPQAPDIDTPSRTEPEAAAPREAEQRETEPGATEPAAAPRAVSPPVPLETPPALYPPEALARRLAGVVTLHVLVERDGRVSHAEVAESAGPLLDAAALEAVQRWRFSPARRDGEPVVARITVPFEFTPPVPSGADPSAAPAASSSSAAPSTPDATLPDATPTDTTDAAPPHAHTADPHGDPVEIEVRGERLLRPKERSASDFIVERELLAAAPHQEGADVLATAPGLFVARGEGLAVAHRYMLRGFDAEHGQDIEIEVGGLPINLPSHVHGQGYADLGFLIGDVVQSLHAIEGVYDPRQGDFAVAGSLRLELGVERRGWLVASGYGSFDTFRKLARWAPPGHDRATFGAVQYQRTDGFGDNRAGQSASAIGQLAVNAGDFRYRALAIAYAARADSAGVVRLDDVDAGRVGYYSVYPYATAQAQNALAARVMVGVFAEHRGAEGESGDLGLWLGVDRFRQQQNFTGFIQRSQTLANVSGRGDLIEQRNATRSIGASGRYRSAAYHLGASTHGHVELGFDARLDTIEQAQNLLDAVVRNQTWDRRIDADILATDLGFYGDLDWRLAPGLALRLGARADVLAYEIDDRLGNRTTLTRPDDTFIVGFRRSALGVAAGPRATVELRPVHWLTLRAAYGEGYRSPQARTLDDGEDAPFSKVRSADVGLRLGDRHEHALTLSGYSTWLSDDVAFEAEEGRLERIGATRRLGAVLHGESHPLPWVVAAASVTVVDAELREPPPPTAEEPQPPFVRGQSLPFVPPVVVRADFGARPTLVEALAGSDLEGRAGLGLSWLSPRPLPYDERASAVGLVDASLGLSWSAFELGLEVYNLLDARYAASELSFASSWDPEGVRPRTPARHIAAGAPRAWMLTLSVAP